MHCLAGDEQAELPRRDDDLSAGRHLRLVARVRRDERLAAHAHLVCAVDDPPLLVGVHDLLSG